MLAELMLPDQAHVRSQDWTIFFLHKDGATEGEEGAMGAGGRTRRKRRRREDDGQARAGAEINEEEGSEEDDEESEEEEEEGEDELVHDDDNPTTADDLPPLVYVLNLVNTKQDHTVKRGAIVKAMAICTRHSFLHIYKPLLLLALQQYFANPVLDTLASLYDAVNSMDLSLMPRLSAHEKFVLQSSDAKDLFLEKFEAIIAQRMSANATSKESGDTRTTPSPTTHQHLRNRYGLPRDTHEFESVVKYAHVPVPVKIPVALSTETVGDFSLIKLITTFNTPHTTSPVPFNPTHPHLTTNGSNTHPIIVLLNALLTQKRIIFLGHNLPSSDVAEAVLGACALASGGLLRGFTRHAFPYTDLTKIDDLLQVPGFIAGVTNPAFAHKSEWWDLLCDLGTGRMRISARIEPVALTEGVRFFHQNGGHPAGGGGGLGGPGGGISALVGAGASLSAGLGGNAVPAGSLTGDATGDSAFMANVVVAINERHGENAIRSKFRRWVLKFTRLAAAFEEAVYGATPLLIHAPPFTPNTSPHVGTDPSDSPTAAAGGLNNKHVPLALPPEVAGHGYVWPTPTSKTSELAANATRIEGWRLTRSYYHFIQDLAHAHQSQQIPVRDLDLPHLHDKLAKLRLSHDASANIYLAICAAVRGEGEIMQLLAVIAGASYDLQQKGGGAGGQQGGLFFLALGLFHPRQEVREQVALLLGRVRGHEAGRHFWGGVGRFAKIAWGRVMGGREVGGGGEEEEEVREGVEVRG